MRKITNFLGIISLMMIIGMTVIGCNKKVDSPTDVVKKLHTAIEKEDAKAIGELMTPEGAETIIMVLSKISNLIAASGEITASAEEIEGDYAYVEVTYANGETSEWELVKVDGVWKVDLDMSK